MRHQPWLRYVHWFGYLASIIVLLELIFLVYLAVAEWRRSEDRRNDTRMHMGPVGHRLTDQYCGEDEIAQLRRLPPLSALGTDGFRALLGPSFNDTHFAIALRRTPTGGGGVMIMIPMSADTPCKSSAESPAQTIVIKIPVDRYDRLTTQLDQIANSWRGEASWWADGTGVVFERVRRNGVTSGFGNSPNFYGKIGALIFDAIEPTTPQLARLDSSWHPKDR